MTYFMVPIQICCLAGKTQTKRENLVKGGRGQGGTQITNAEE